MRKFILIASIAISIYAFQAFAASPGGKSPPSKISKKATSVVREEVTVVMGKVKERWRLEWIYPPELTCAPEDGYYSWGMCPCEGFEFGEAGELDLVRIRPGLSEERLHLTPFFGETPFFREGPGPTAVLRRWPVLRNDIHLASQESEQREKTGKSNIDLSELGKQVRSRPSVTVMHFADYDHDGRATEFVLQVGSSPCGHQQTVLVGISSHNPRLHVFGTAEHPDRPLTLEHPSDWEKLLHSKGEVSVVQVGCGDHGSEQETEIRLRTDERGIHATQSVYKCGSSFKRGQLISQEIL